MKNSAVRILYLDHSSDFSGGQVSLLILLDSLDKSKFKPFVVVNKNAKRSIEQLRKKGIEPLIINYFNDKPFELLLFPFVILKVVSLSRKYNIDLIHSNTFKSGIIGGITSKLLGISSIFRARLGLEYNGHGFIDYMIYRLNSMILANSNYVKRTFENKLKVSGEKIITVYNPITYKSASNINFVNETRNSYDKKIIGVIGRVEKFKRIDELVFAVEELIEKSNNFVVRVIGAPSKVDNGKYFDYLKDLISKKGLEKHFEFVGFIENVSVQIKKLDILVLCSKGEALPRSIFESQLQEKVVIVSNSGGNLELVEDNYTGLLYEAGNPKDLAQKILEVIKDKPNTQMGRNAKISVLEKFSKENTINKETALYLKLVQS